MQLYVDRFLKTELEGSANNSDKLAKRGENSSQSKCCWGGESGPRGGQEEQAYGKSIAVGKKGKTRGLGVLTLVLRFGADNVS